MRFKVRRREINRVYNVKGKLIASDYEYYIVVKRLFKRKRYLRLLPGWKDKLDAGDPCNVEITGARYNATTFKEKALADTVAYFIKHQPDNYRL